MLARYKPILALSLSACLLSTIIQTKLLAMRPTLRKAAGQVLLIMKVSIQFLKNAENSKDSVENGAKENEDSEAKIDDDGESKEDKKEGDEPKKGNTYKWVLWK